MIGSSMREELDHSFITTLHLATVLFFSFGTPSLSGMLLQALSKQLCTVSESYGTKTTG